MSIIKSWFGYLRVVMFVPAGYSEEFKHKILNSGLCKDIDCHKTTTEEATRFRIKKPCGFVSVIAVVSHRNKDKLKNIKNAFDRYVSEDIDRKNEEARLARKDIRISKKKISKAKKRPEENEKKKLKSSRIRIKRTKERSFRA